MGGGLEPIVSPDGRHLYYAKPPPVQGIWEVPPREARKSRSSSRGRSLSFDVAENGNLHHGCLREAAGDGRDVQLRLAADRSGRTAARRACGYPKLLPHRHARRALDAVRANSIPWMSDIEMLREFRYLLAFFDWACTRRGTSRRSIRFGPFTLDGRSGELRNGPTRLKVPDQSIAVLQALLERPGELVTREALRDRLWGPDTFVDFEAGLNAAVRRLREALNDSADIPRYVETLPRRGYRFIASSGRWSSTAAPPAPAALAGRRGSGLRAFRDRPGPGESVVRHVVIVALGLTVGGRGALGRAEMAITPRRPPARGPCPSPDSKDWKSIRRSLPTASWSRSRGTVGVEITSTSTSDPSTAALSCS